MGVQFSKAALAALEAAGLSTVEIERLQAKKNREATLSTLVDPASALLAAAFEAGMEIKPSSKDTSSWVGGTVQSIPVTHDGQEFTVSITVKDLAKSAARATAQKANA
jgi:hypothetical protein